MTKVTIDAALFTKLVGVREVAQLCDSAGRLVGFFHPGPPRDENGNVILPFSEEELQRRSQESDGGRPLRDILDDLSKL
jgi:hypothetical protein